MRFVGVVSQPVGRLEALVADGTRVVVQRNVLGNADGGVELCIAGGA
jgi:hypothetical protein